jgi:N-acetylglucosamine kinase-like BadF-type ATPase
MSYFLGIDGGGTKTDCVLLDSQGQVLRRSQGGPSNPLRSGYTRAWFSVSGAADTVLARQSLKATDIRGICGGFGGAARPAVAKRMSVFLERSFPKAEVKVTSDIEIALAAAVEKGVGVVLIAGTGSVAYGRNAHGKTVRAGGWGPWLGDQGSAFDIGRSALTAVRRHEDGLGPATELSDRVFKNLEWRNWGTLIEHIAKNPDEVFPRVYPLVARAAQHGDEVSRKILDSAADALVELADHVIRQLGLTGEKFPLVRAGGVFGHCAYLDSIVDARLAAIANRATIGPLQTSPAEAAAQMARTAAGRAADAN